MEQLERYLLRCIAGHMVRYLSGHLLMKLDRSTSARKIAREKHNETSNRALFDGQTH